MAMISERIKILRKKSKLSQTEFGKCLGVSRDVIANLEYGRVNPKEPFISLLCSVFNINKDWLLSGNGEPTDENIESKRNINEALKIFNSLLPELQEYALIQMKGLLNFQSKFESKYQKTEGVNS
jgi:transcriptional regulator with XRE-family HTH domain